MGAHSSVSGTQTHLSQEKQFGAGKRKEQTNYTEHAVERGKFPNNKA